MSEKFTQQEFSRQMETFFHVKSDSADPVELKLIEVKSIPDSEAFSLLFVGPAENFLHQHTYRFDHKVIGGFDLFIVPVGQRNEGFVYQAIFNPSSAG